jgi:hypothetical protein
MNTHTLTSAGIPQLRRLALDDPSWREFVARRTEATVFHHPAWATCLSGAYGYRPMALALEDRGRLEAGLPLLEVSSPLTGRRLIGLPFTDRCEPLATSDDARSRLLEALAGWQAELGRIPIEVHSELPPGPRVHTRPDAVWHRMELAGDPDLVRRGLRSRLRQYLAQSDRMGVKARIGHTLADVETFYRLHRQTRHRQGVPVQPWRFFRGLWSHLIDAGLGAVAIGESSGQPVSAAVFLAWNGHLIYKYGASDETQWKLRANNVVMWAGIEWGIENGCRDLDFGRSDVHNQGLRDFKSRWGGEEIPLTYSTLSEHAPRPSSGRGLAVVGAVVRRSPEPVGRLLGELLYAHVA